MKLYVVEKLNEKLEIVQVGCSTKENVAFGVLKALAKEGFDCWISEYKISKKDFTTFA